MVSVSNGWVAYITDSVMLDGKIWLTHANGENEPIIISTENSSQTSYPAFSNGVCYFWQEAAAEEETGLYSYEPDTATRTLLYSDPESDLFYRKIYVDDKYILLDQGDGGALILDKIGEKVKMLELFNSETDDHIHTKTSYINLASRNVLFYKNTFKREPGKRPIEISKDYYIYDINSDEQVNIGATADLGSTANQVSQNSGAFTFVEMIALDGPVPENFEWNLNVYNPIMRSVHSIDYNAPFDSKNDYRGRLYSSIYEDMIVYPSGIDHDLWHLDIFDINKKLSYRITNDKGVYLYPTISDNKVSYFKENFEEGGFNLFFHNIATKESEIKNIKRELVFEDEEEITKTEKPIIFIKSLGNYLVWIEYDEDEEINDVFSYDFETQEKLELLSIPGWGIFSGFAIPKYFFNESFFVIGTIEERSQISYRTVSLDGEIDRIIEDPNAKNIGIHDIQGDYLYLSKRYEDSKLDGCFEYNMRSGKSEFLFDFKDVERNQFGFSYKTWIDLYVHGDKFLICGDKNSIFLASRNGEIERIICAAEMKTEHFRTENTIESMIGDYLIIESKVITPKIPGIEYLDMFNEQIVSCETYCYNAGNNSLYQSKTDAFGFVPSTYTNYCNPNIIVTGEYNNDDNNTSKEISYKAIDLSKGSEVDLITRNSADFRNRVKFFEVAGDIVAFENNEDSNYTICDTLTGKMYTFENTVLALSKDRIMYLKNRKILSQKYSFVIEE